MLYPQATSTTIYIHRMYTEAQRHRESLHTRDAAVWADCAIWHFITCIRHVWEWLHTTQRCPTYRTIVHMCRKMHHAVHTQQVSFAQLFMTAPVTILPYPHTMSMLLHRGHVRITIFSKFFSQLPHGKCFLSVSDICQHFDEMWHPFAFHSRGTLLEQYTPYMDVRRSHTGLSPSFARCCK